MSNPQPPQNARAIPAQSPLTASNLQRLKAEVQEMEVEHGHPALQAAFPRLFREGTRSVHALEHPRGWHLIMRELLSKVNALLDDRQVHGFTLLQTKSKFGGLRVHWSLEVPEDASPAVQAQWARSSAQDEQTKVLIREADQCARQLADQTCERCADAATTINTGGWYATLCVPCQVRAERGQLWDS